MNDTELTIFAISLIEKYSLVDPLYLNQDNVVQKIEDILKRHIEKIVEEDIINLSDLIAQELIYPVLGLREESTTDCLRSGCEPHLSTFGEICNDLDNFLLSFKIEYV
jgi:hypothetical protein